jgi:uncharacterized protein DUF2510
MTTPNPGWYDDPEDSNALRYWDGQGWTPQRQPKTTSASAGQSTTQTPQHPPAPPAPPPPTGGTTPKSQLQPYAEKGRRLWSGLSGQQKIIVSIAAVFVAIAAIMLPFFAFGHGANQSPSLTGPAGPKGGSQYYQWGYESATSGAARRDYIDLACPPAVPGAPDYGCSNTDPDTTKQACGGARVDDPNIPADFKVEDPDTSGHQAKEDDYMRGCRDGFRDHPPSPTKTTIPQPPRGDY